MSQLDLVIATGNAHKIDEMKEHLSPWFNVHGLPKDYVSPEEDGSSFAANARIKAESAARQLGRLCLSDDSGICVDFLDGAPGIYSARFAGETCDDEANNDLLLARLIAVPREQRSARFICALSLAGPRGEIAAFEAAFEGYIGRERRGGGGFGYDPIFMLPEGCSSAELSPRDKQRRSHRGQALAKLAHALRQTKLLSDCIAAQANNA